MSDEQSLAPYRMPEALRNYDPPAPSGLSVITIPDAEMEIIRRDFTPQGKDKLTDEEFEMFITTCRRAGLHPALRQIHCAKFNGRMTIMMGIDGYRMIAERTGSYGGRESITWYDDDGNAFEFWSKKKGNPAGCKVVVLKLLKGHVLKTEGKASWDSFNKAASNAPNNKWKEMPDHMLAIRAESHALRAAFPNELRGVEFDEGGGEQQQQQSAAATMRVEPQSALTEPQQQPQAQAQPRQQPQQQTEVDTPHLRFLAEWKRQQLPEGKAAVVYVTSVIDGALPAPEKTEARDAAFEKALEDLKGRVVLRDAAIELYKQLGRPETRQWPDVNIALGIQDARDRVLTGEQWAKLYQWATDQLNEQRGGGDLELTAPEPDPFRSE